MGASNLIFSWISLSFDFESEKIIWAYYYYFYSFGKKMVVLIFVSDEEEEVPWMSRTDCSAPPMTLSSSIISFLSFPLLLQLFFLLVLFREHGQRIIKVWCVRVCVCVCVCS